MKQNELYLIRKNSDGAIAKLWYRDEVVAFSTNEEMINYVARFPMFFGPEIELDIEVVIVDDLECNFVLYSDIIKDEEFIKEYQNIGPKYSIWNTDGNGALCDSHMLCFDTKEEIEEFVETFPGFVINYEYNVAVELINRGWYLFMNYKDFVKSEYYAQALEEYGK